MDADHRAAQGITRGQRVDAQIGDDDNLRAIDKQQDIAAIQRAGQAKFTLDPVCGYVVIRFFRNGIIYKVWRVKKAKLSAG